MAPRGVDQHLRAERAAVARADGDAVVARVDLRDRALADDAAADGGETSAQRRVQAAPVDVDVREAGRQIGVAIFYASFPDVPLNTWDRHFYGEHGAMISGSRIRDGLYRYILEADLDDKQQRGMKPVEFYEFIAEKYDSWIHERCMREPRIGDVWAMAPLGHRAADVARDRLLLVGDAAGYLSPFTGQGIEFAMRGARLAAQAVSAAARRGDFGAPAFASYLDGRDAEVAAQVAHLRSMLRFVRDRDALLRASTDDSLRAQHLLPLPVVERGSLA